MYCGKSLELYKVYDNYKRQGKQTICVVPSTAGEIKSKVNDLKVPAVVVAEWADISLVVGKYLPDCVLVDEAQFLTKDQVLQLVKIVDLFDIPVIAYGLKNTYKNTLFNGSHWLLIYADRIEEIKTICYYCDCKATMVLRFKDGVVTYDGPDISLKDEEGIEYFPVCRRCYAAGGSSKVSKTEEVAYCE